MNFSLPFVDAGEFEAQPGISSPAAAIALLTTTPNTPSRYWTARNRDAIPRRLANSRFKDLIEISPKFDNYRTALSARRIRLQQRLARRQLRLIVLAAVVLCAAIGGTFVFLASTQAPATPKVLWGMGDEISGALSTITYRHARINMIDSWYNGPDDLNWMSGYAKGDTMSQLYGKGKALELEVWLADDPSYAISAQFQADIKTLVRVFKGNGPHYGPLYVVLFTEWETYSSDPAYFVALRSAYLHAVRVIHSEDHRAYVALGFGGYDWSAASPTRNLRFWKKAIDASNFTAFQAMQASTSTAQNGQSIIVPEINDAVKQLGSYGKPVMISNFDLWGTNPTAAATFRKVTSALMNKSNLQTLTSEGLFAWSFMNDDYINTSGPNFRRVRSLLARFAAPAYRRMPTRSST